MAHPVVFCCGAICAIPPKGTGFEPRNRRCSAGPKPQDEARGFRPNRRRENRLRAEVNVSNLSFTSSHASRILNVVRGGLKPAGIDAHVTRSWYRCMKEYGIEPTA